MVGLSLLQKITKLGVVSCFVGISNLYQFICKSTCVYFVSWKIGMCCKLRCDSHHVTDKIHYGTSFGYMCCFQEGHTDIISANIM